MPRTTEDDACLKQGVHIHRVSPCTHLVHGLTLNCINVVAKLRVFLTWLRRDADERSWTTIQEEGKPPYLITFSTVIDQSQLLPSYAELPQDSREYNVMKETIGEKSTQFHQTRLRLTEMKGVRLRLWKLEEEA